MIEIEGAEEKTQTENLEPDMPPAGRGIGQPCELGGERRVSTRRCRLDTDVSQPRARLITSLTWMADRMRYVAVVQRSASKELIEKWAKDIEKIADQIRNG